MWLLVRAKVPQSATYVPSFVDPVALQIGVLQQFLITSIDDRKRFVIVCDVERRERDEARQLDDLLDDT